MPYEKDSYHVVLRREGTGTTIGKPIAFDDRASAMTYVRGYNRSSQDRAWDAIIAVIQEDGSDGSEWDDSPNCQ